MSPLVSSITTALSILTILGGVFVVLIFLLILNKKPSTIKNFLAKNALLFSFLITLGSVLGSLFYSSVADFSPCYLCWWQRVFMFPQAIILGIALIKKDISVRPYIIALASIGALIALYHTYIQFGGVPLGPCPAGSVSCDLRYFVEFGYVTIPTMALTSFMMILVTMILSHKESKKINSL
jgi:disulfide bond formation protein DsbB